MYCINCIGRPCVSWAQMYTNFRKITNVWTNAAARTVKRAHRATKIPQPAVIMMAIKKWNFLFFLSFFEVVAALHSVLVSLPDITSCLLGLLKMNRILPPLNYANQMHIPFLPFDDYAHITGNWMGCAVFNRARRTLLYIKISTGGQKSTSKRKTGGNFLDPLFLFFYYFIIYWKNK